MTSSITASSLNFGCSGLVISSLEPSGCQNDFHGSGRRQPRNFRSENSAAKGEEPEPTNSKIHLFRGRSLASTCRKRKYADSASAEEEKGELRAGQAEISSV